MTSLRSWRHLLLLVGVAATFLMLTVSVALAAKPASHGHGGGGGKPTSTPGTGTKTVCVDPGHGGADPGAVYTYNGVTLQEKDLTLEIGQVLQSELESSGYTVVMTRTSDLPLDQTMSNTERATICNNANANAVIAIHLNASSDPTIDYFQDFWGKKNKDLAFAQTITNTYMLPNPTGDGYVTDNQVGQFASGVLLKSNAPATLVETVFLSNPAEHAALAQGDQIHVGTGSWNGTRQQAIADQLDAGLNAWLTTR